MNGGGAGRGEDRVRPKICSTDSFEGSTALVGDVRCRGSSSRFLRSSSSCSEMSEGLRSHCMPVDVRCGGGGMGVCARADAIVIEAIDRCTSKTSGKVYYEYAIPYEVPVQSYS